MERIQANPLVRALSRAGALGALLYYLVKGLGLSAAYGRAIGEDFARTVAVGPFESAFFTAVLVALAVLLVGLALMMMLILFGGLFGALLGIVLSPALGVTRNREGHE